MSGIPLLTDVSPHLKGLDVTWLRKRLDCWRLAEMTLMHGLSLGPVNTYAITATVDVNRQCNEEGAAKGVPLARRPRPQWWFTARSRRVNRPCNQPFSAICAVPFASGLLI
jgi:hypothetical protein